MNIDELLVILLGISDKENPRLEFASSLYHYTDSNALMNIIKSDELWLTQREFMNDVYEMTYANEILHKAYSIVYESNGDIQYNKFIDENYNNKSKQYVLSLTTENDLVSQWAYYGGNDGYCLEFIYSQIKGHFLGKGLIFNSGRVIYEEKNQIDIMVNLIKCYKENEELLIKEPQNVNIQNDLDTIYMLIGSYQSLIKQHNNYCEKEFRIVLTSSEKCEFKIKNGIIIPYKKVNVGKKVPIKNIIIGPRISDEIAEYGLRQLLYSIPGKAHIGVKHSSMKIR